MHAITPLQQAINLSHLPMAEIAKRARMARDRLFAIAKGTDKPQKVEKDRIAMALGEKVEDLWT